MVEVGTNVNLFNDAPARHVKIRIGWSGRRPTLIPVNGLKFPVPSQFALPSARVAVDSAYEAAHLFWCLSASMGEAVPLIARLKERRDKIQAQLDRWISHGFKGGGDGVSGDATRKETADRVSEVAQLNRTIAEEEKRDA